MRKLARLLGLITLFWASVFASNVQAQNVSGGIATQLPGPAEQVRDALVSAGATACVDSIYQAARYLFADGQGQFAIQPLGPDINTWPIVVTIESQHQDIGAHRLSILTIAPAGTCSGTYEQIITWEMSCDAVKTSVFPNFNNESLLFRNVRQSELTPGIQVYLMQAANGCVSIKKELIG